MEKIIISLFFICSAPTFSVKADVLAEYSENYNECLSVANGEHPKIIDCLESEKSIARETESRLLSKMYDDVQTRLISRIKKMEPEWTLHIKEKCSVFVDFGGQRGELLRSDCEVKEELGRLKYIRNILDQSEI